MMNKLLRKTMRAERLRRDAERRRQSNLQHNYERQGRQIRSMLEDRNRLQVKLPPRFVECVVDEMRRYLARDLFERLMQERGEDLLGIAGPIAERVATEIRVNGPILEPKMFVEWLKAQARPQVQFSVSLPPITVAYREDQDSMRMWA